jgi:hypothetical protein
MRRCTGTVGIARAKCSRSITMRRGFDIRIARPRIAFAQLPGRL